MLASDTNRNKADVSLVCSKVSIVHSCQPSTPGP